MNPAFSASDRLSALLLLVLGAASGSSCSKEPVYTETSPCRLEFSFPEEVLWCDPGEPELIEVLFYDHATGEKVHETYLPPEGGSIRSVTPGEWDIVAFTMGSERTRIGYTRSLGLISASTSLVQRSPQRICESPDHVFVSTLKDVTVPQLTSDDPPFTIGIPLLPLCDSWRVEISGITGLEYAAGITLYVYDQAEEVSLSDMQTEGSCAIVRTGYVEGDLAVIPFCTFGMPPDGEQVLVQAVIESQDGQRHSCSADVTSQVRSPLRRDHIIRLDWSEELQPLVPGGLDPSADEWEDSSETVDIM